MIAGIDLGGTQVRIAIADDDGTIRSSTRTRTALLNGPPGLAAWAAGQLERHGLRAGGGPGTGARRKPRDPVRRIAIGAPGPIDGRRGVLVNPPNLPGWQNSPLAELVGDACGCPVDLENDANLAGVGEFHRGAGRGATDMVYMTWSTGIGGGIISNGRLLSGAHGTAGEIGHMVIDPDGPLDACGQRGCLEAFAGGRALQRQTGESAAELFAAAERGDQEALAIVRRAAHYVGVGLINLANLLDPETIVVGGGVARSWKLVSPVLEDALRGSPFIKPARRPKLRRARLGDSAGQAGAVEWARLHL